jgi:hypothetical protein
MQRHATRDEQRRKDARAGDTRLLARRSVRQRAKAMTSQAASFSGDVTFL